MSFVSSQVSIELSLARAYYPEVVGSSLRHSFSCALNKLKATDPFLHCCWFGLYSLLNSLSDISGLVYESRPSIL